MQDTNRDTFVIEVVSCGTALSFSIYIVWLMGYFKYSVIK